MSKQNPLHDFYYCLLTDGNKEEFAELEAEMVRRKVDVQYRLFPGGRVYRFPGTNLKKMPYDRSAKERYFGDANSGHAIYPMKDVEEYLTCVNAEKVWRTIVKL
jgi:hypothetical protein